MKVLVKSVDSLGVGVVYAAPRDKPAEVKVVIKFYNFVPSLSSGKVAALKHTK